jgi:hypothetical protein
MNVQRLNAKGQLMLGGCADFTIGTRKSPGCLEQNVLWMDAPSIVLGKGCAAHITEEYTTPITGKRSMKDKGLI